MPDRSIFRPFGDPVAQLDFWMYFGDPLAPFGSLWLPFGSLWPPFGSLLAPLAPFWLTLAIFWLAFAHPKATFPPFCCLLPSFLQLFEFSMKILCKICVFLKIVIGKSSCRSTKSQYPEECRTHPYRNKIIFCTPPFQGPERTLPKAIRLMYI